MKWMVYILMFLMHQVSVHSTQAQARFVGEGMMDGVYGFSLTLMQLQEDYHEGHVTFEYDGLERSMIALVGDTIMGQEVDDYGQPRASLILVDNQNGYWTGEWHDIQASTRLPVQVKTASALPRMKDELMAYRYSIDDDQSDPTVAWTYPLSPTVVCGVLMIREAKKMLPYSRVSHWSDIYWYTSEGPLEESPSLGAPIETVSVKSIFEIKDGYSIEARIPLIDEVFVEEITAMMSSREAQTVTSRSDEGHRPLRYYALIDIDYWTDDLVSGSTELIGPAGSLGGETFVYDRKAKSFISLDELIKTSDWEMLISVEDEAMGYSFDYYGIFLKRAFHHTIPRRAAYIPWSESGLKIKRRLVVLD